MTNDHALSHLEAVRFRGLQGTTLEGLSGANLIIGRAASGKSSLLEAIWLFLNRDNAARSVRAPVVQRGVEPPDNPLLALSRTGTITLRGTHNGAAASLTCSGVPDGVDAHGNIRYAVTVCVRPRPAPKTPDDFTVAALHASAAYAAACLILLEAQGFKQEALDDLQPLVPTLADLEAVPTDRHAYPRVIARTKDGAVAAEHLGGSALAMITAVLAVHAARGQVLLLDDFCDAVDGYYVKPLWTTLKEIAARHRVQVFAATHAAACVRGAAQAFADAPDRLTLSRLLREGNGIYAATVRGQAVQDQANASHCLL